MGHYGMGGALNPHYTTSRQCLTSYGITCYSPNRNVNYDTLNVYNMHKYTHKLYNQYTTFDIIQKISNVYNNLNLMFSLIIQPLNCSCNHVYSYHVHMYYNAMCFFCDCCLLLLLLLIPYSQAAKPPATFFIWCKDFNT